MSQGDEQNGSISALVTAFNAVIDLLRSTLETTNASYKILMSRQSSGATDRLDAQAVKDAEQQRQIDGMVESQLALTNRVWTLDRKVNEIYDWSMPWWVRLQRRIKAQKEWREGKND